MPALVQYAEAEAVLKKVQESSLRLENNLDVVLQSRQQLDPSTDQAYVDTYVDVMWKFVLHLGILIPAIVFVFIAVINIAFFENCVFDILRDKKDTF